MNNKKIINTLVILIAVFSLVAALIGVFSTGGFGSKTITSIHGQFVELYGKGIYQYDSKSAAAQAIGQDFVTIILGVPVLVFSLIITNKNSFRGKIVLTGTVAYILYTYASYCFLSMYNPLFLIYVVLFSMSLFTFIMLMMSFEINKIKEHFSHRLPIKFLSILCFFLSFMLLMMWLGRIVPPLMEGTYPDSLEHYTTLTIQVLDLGLIVPVGVLCGVLLLKKTPLGYLLMPVFIIKGFTLITAIFAMMINMMLSGVKVAPLELIIFTLFNIFILISFIIVLKNVKETEVA